MCLGYWISFVSEKGREAIEGFLNKGVYQVEKLKEEGWITNIFYDDEVQISLEPLLSWKSIYVNNFNNFLWAQMSFCFCFCFFFFCVTLLLIFSIFSCYILTELLIYVVLPIGLYILVEATLVG